jgi:hypothetical protein
MAVGGQTSDLAALPRPLPIVLSESGPSGSILGRCNRAKNRDNRKRMIIKVYNSRSKAPPCRRTPKGFEPGRHSKRPSNPPGSKAALQAIGNGTCAFVGQASLRSKCMGLAVSLYVLLYLKAFPPGDRSSR